MAGWATSCGFAYRSRVALWDAATRGRICDPFFFALLHHHVPRPRGCAVCPECLLLFLYGAFAGRDSRAYPYETWRRGRLRGRGGVPDSGCRFCLGWFPLLDAGKVDHMNALLLIISLVAQAPATAEDSVRALESQRAQALLQADTIALSRLVADDFVEIFRRGILGAKA